MEVLYRICCAISLGTLIGFLLGVFKLQKPRQYTENQTLESHALQRKAGNVLKYLTLFSLIMGLIWCFYFLVLGCVDADQAEYATNMAQLIVSFLTVISIIFAFSEFLQQNRDR